MMPFAWCCFLAAGGLHISRKIRYPFHATHPTAPRCFVVQAGVRGEVASFLRLFPALWFTCLSGRLGR